MSSSAGFPGFDSPAVGFEQPFEMLLACHQRVRRSLDLLGRLIDQVADRGHDEQSRTAARDILRYFDLAAPKHHEDEERHVFPILLEQRPDLLALVQGLQGDHERMTELWAGLREVLLGWAGPEPGSPDTADLRQIARVFVDLYRQHLQVEEQQIFPAALTLTDAASLAAMGEEMQGRRRA